MIKYLLLVMLMLTNNVYANSEEELTRFVSFDKCSQGHIKIKDKNISIFHTIKGMEKEVTISFNGEIEKVIEMLAKQSGYELIYKNKRPYRLLLEVNKQEEISYLIHVISSCFSNNVNNYYFDNISIFEGDKKIVIEYVEE